jgi:hypothetical protein
MRQIFLHNTFKISKPLKYKIDASKSNTERLKIVK